MEDYDELFGSFIRKGVWMVCAQTGPEEIECQMYKIPFFELPGALLGGRIFLGRLSK